MRSVASEDENVLLLLAVVYESLEHRWSYALLSGCPLGHVHTVDHLSEALQLLLESEKLEAGGECGNTLQNE
jgi:hypothetical protein